MKLLTTLVLATLFLTNTALSQADFELRGPNRDGYYPNEKLLDKWPETGPQLIKSIKGIGEGFTLPAVTNDRIYITGMICNTGYLFSYDTNGNLLWKKEYGPEWTNNFPGSRSTPTIVGDKIYFTDSFGHIFCYNKSGEKEWKIDMKKEFGFREIEWGANESLVIEGSKLYCTPGGEEVMIAVLNRHTGNTIKTIKGNGQKSAHCSPVIVNHKNKKLLLTMTGQAFVGVDLNSDQMVFQHEFKNEWGGNCNIPMYKDGYVLISTQGTGSKLLKISDDAKSVKEIWYNKLYDSENEGAIIVGDHVYLGANENKSFYCFELQTGKMKYVDKKMLGKTNVIYADGMLYSYNFRGYVSLIKPNTQKLEVISRFKMPDGTKQHICHPVIKKGRLYIRHGDAFNIYDIASI